MKLNKKNVERMCREAGLFSARREVIKGYDVFVSDGFSAKPSVTFKRFGVDPGDFSWGAWCTIWWVARGDDHFEVGRPMLFDAFHNSDYDFHTKRQARINSALLDARDFIMKRQSASEGNVLHA